MFKEEIVDLAHGFLILEVTSDPGKMVAIEQLLQEYGIVEIARTCKTSLTCESNFNIAIVNDLCLVQESQKNLGQYRSVAKL